ncbi:MAG TPA: hypothetical protein VM555_07725 [Tahibacter sp.]|nr:hypothetical protein [Tahibacter sp.]
MRKALLLASLTALLPSLAAAQSLVLEPAEPQSRQALLDNLLRPGGTGADLSLMPMWSTPDGRILIAAAKANPGQMPLAPASPQVGGALDWQLVDATALLGAARIGANSHLSVGLGAVPLVLADPDHAAFAGCGALRFEQLAYAGDCLAGAPTASYSAGNWYAGNLVANWAKDDFSFDLGLGLSWLESAVPSTFAPVLSSALPTLSLPGSTLPSLVIPARDAWRFSDSSMLGAHGRWAFSPEQSLDLGASFGRIRLNPDAAGIRSEWQQSALSLGLSSNSLSTSITGRLYNPTTLTSNGTPGQRWTGIDLGVTWRTPWRADLSIGAQNLWTSPPLTGEEAEAQARIPYVQYHQDL